jgi:hypothetical protein
MNKCEAWPHRREKYVSHIGQVIGKADGGYVEVKPFPILVVVKKNCKERGEKIVGGVGEVGKVSQERKGNPFQDQGGMVSEEKIVNPDQERIKIVRVDVVDQAT